MSASPHNSTRRWPTLAVCLLAGLLLTRLPQSVSRAVRTSLHDTIAPLDAGWKWAVALRDEALQSEQAELQQQLQRIRAEHDTAQRELRRQRLENAALHEELQRRETLGPDRYRGQETAPLFVSDLLQAELLGPDHQRLLRQGLLVSAGSAQSIAEESLVLDDSGEQLVLDQGADTGVPVAAPVYAGRCIVGRVDAVGRWTSSIKLLTDAEYRGRAQILRTGPDGSQFGPEGILEGTGSELCLLKYIDRTESVSVGEEVYSGGRSTAMPYPMFYGTVVKAELDPSDREWTVWIKPAIEPTQLRTVQILRHEGNSIRVLGH